MKQLQLLFFGMVLLFSNLYHSQCIGYTPVSGGSLAVPTEQNPIRTKFMMDKEYTPFNNNVLGVRYTIDASNGGYISVYDGTNPTGILMVHGKSSVSFNGIGRPIYIVLSKDAYCSNDPTFTSTVTAYYGCPYGTLSLSTSPLSGLGCIGGSVGMTSFNNSAYTISGYQWQVDTGAGFQDIPGAMQSSYGVSNITAMMSGYKYRVKATTTNNCVIISDYYTLTIASNPSIGTHPSDKTICVRGNTTFTASATNATGYQWQVDTGGGFTNVSNNGIYSGATTSTLTITDAISEMNNYKYRLIANGTCTSNATSNSATLTVKSGASISQQSTNATGCVGGTASFSVVATDATSYQWQLNSGAGFFDISDGGFFSGATTSTLTVKNLLSNYNGEKYRLVVTGACGNIISDTATLSVVSATSIISQPSSRNICAGSTTSFTVVASNAPAYQWQVNTGSGYTDITDNTNYSGATTATLSVSNATLAMSGYSYRVKITGCNEIFSNNAQLNVVPQYSMAIPEDISVCMGTQVPELEIDIEAGTLCVVGDENWVFNVTAPAGTVFTGVKFASYGTPQGSCGSFTKGTCHTTNTESILADLAIGKTSFSFTANNATFGDPCSGTPKWFRAELEYEPITTFTWTNSHPSIGLAASGTGNIPAFTAINNTSEPITATITIQPTTSVGGVPACVGASVSYEIVVYPVSPAPTGEATQSFDQGDDLSVLVVDGTDIKWYASESDASSHTNELPVTTKIVNNTTYYTTQNIGGCESTESLAVLAYNSTLTVDDIAKHTQITIYPNPVKDVLNLNSTAQISKVEIISVEGRVIATHKVQSIPSINVSALASGVYLLKIYTDKGQHIEKFIKH